MSDLLETARRLATAGSRRPRQADLRRAVSTAYYAMFHVLADEIATNLVGRRSEANRDAWVRAYRATEHGRAKEACTSKRRLDALGNEIKMFAAELARLQDERHRADYDPLSSYQRNAVLDLIAAANHAITELRRAPAHQRLLVVTSIVFKDRP